MKKIIILILLMLPSVTSAYEFNGIDYKITMPENIEKLEFCYNSGCCKVDERSALIIKLNMLLIKNGYEPLYK